MDLLGDIAKNMFKKNDVKLNENWGTNRISYTYNYISEKNIISKQSFFKCVLTFFNISWELLVWLTSNKNC